MCCVVLCCACTMNSTSSIYIYIYIERPFTFVYVLMMLRSHRLCLCIDEFCSPISSLGTAGMHIALKMIKRTVKAPKVTSWINREYQNTLLRAYNDEQIKSLNAHTERIRQTWIKFKEKNNTQSETISFNALCQQLYHFDWFMFCHSNRQSVHFNTLWLYFDKFITFLSIFANKTFVPGWWYSRKACWTILFFSR